MRHLPVCFAALLVAVVCCYSWSPAAAPVPPTPPGGKARTPNSADAKPPAPPYVTVTKTDGTQATGLLVATDPGAIKLRAPSPPGKPENEPFSVKWSGISKVSTGLTRQKVLDQWKVEKRDQLCNDCKGEGSLVCPTCKGTLHDPAKLDKACSTYKGELLMDCKAPVPTAALS